MDPRDKVLYHGWILYKDEEGENDHLILLGKFEDKDKKSWHSSGLRAWGISIVMTEGLVGWRFVPHTLLQHSGSRIIGKWIPSTSGKLLTTSYNSL
jgi:hypothetical protein